MSKNETVSVADMPPRKAGRAVWLWVMLMGVGWLVGMVTNCVNGMVCLEYFAWLMNHGRVDDVIRQGFLEGSAVGILAWVLVLPVYCGVTGCRLEVDRLWRAMGWVVVVCLVGHVLGGLVGWTWASRDPKGFGKLFPVGRMVSDVRRCGYVGGAIWGVYGGAVVGYGVLVWGIIREWRRVAGGSGEVVRRDEAA